MRAAALLLLESGLAGMGLACRKSVPGKQKNL
jgi:hypothetical protein